jgi:peroxiredoxin
MKPARVLLAVTVLIALAPVGAAAQTATAADILRKFRPSQPGVDYDIPADQAALEACRKEVLPKNKGHVILDGQGRVLRKFIDTNGTLARRGNEERPYPHLDQWSYYQNGFEVYRELDTNEDGNLDEIRWLNSGGTRIAVVKEGRIVGWKRLSAEEASRVLVQALNAGDAALVGTVMATPEELQALGVPQAIATKVVADPAKRDAAVKALRDGLVGWDAKTIWHRFDGSMPHVIPADAAAGLKADLSLYENAFVFVTKASGKDDPMATAYLQVPELIKVGDTWKFVELPRAIDPKAPVAQVADAGLRAELFRENAAGPADDNNVELNAALTALGNHDKTAPAGESATKRELAAFHVDRVRLLANVIAKTTKPEDRTNYTRQAIDSLAAAYATGLYDAGGAALDKYIARADQFGAFAAYRKLLAEYTRDLDKPGNNLKAQKQFVENLKGFVQKYADADETADALFQLGTISELGEDEKEALGFFLRLAKDFPNSPAGKKAKGAAHRLDLDGKMLELSGNALNGRPVDVAKLRGKTLLVAFWKTDIDAVRRDLPELEKVYRKFKPKGFEIVGVSLDDQKETLEAFVRDQGIAWPQIFEEGGMDGRLANEFGIYSLPTMFLVDTAGKVVDRSLRNAAELERYLEKLLPATGDNVRLGEKPR